jgi:hypothetical protein
VVRIVLSRLRTVHSSFDEEHYPTQEQWQEAQAISSVRLQWDPDHDPIGTKLERGAVQLGLRAEMLKAFSKAELLEVIEKNSSEQRRSYGDFSI